MSSGKPLRVTTPLGKDVLFVQRAVVTETLGRLSTAQLELLSTDPKLKLEDVLGKSMTLTVDLADGKIRHFNGLVSRFSQVGREGRYVQYQAVVRPWLWFLTRTADCRIYPDQKEARSATVPEIVKSVFRLHGFTDFKDELKGTYKPREFCVQYRETDFDFVSRLMEEEGIYYYFEHEEDKHHLVLADAPGSHKASPECEEVPFVPSEKRTVSRVDHFDTWLLTQEVQTGTYALNDYDFEIPRADLLVKASESRNHALAEFPIYDWGSFVGAYKASGESGDPDAADRAQGFARVRLEELQAEYERVEGAGNTRALATGALFKLTDYHHRDDQNREYLVVSTTHEFEVGGYEGIAHDDSTPLCRCTCVAMPSKAQFRSRRTTPRPRIAGHLTATVVGKSGEEIWTDMHGRVKVQFHWDRYGAQDEDSSCWVRVSQAWAGKTWGSIHIPRIGQEVVVAFEEGDPDRPMVIGRVYNGPNKPPYDLPANQSQSGIKSRSTKGGGPDHFNEIRFEDKKGEELLTIHAEKDQSISVENDESHTVGHDRTKEIGHDETTHVKNNRTETVDAEETITIGGNRLESVKKNETIGIDGNRTETVQKDESITINGARTETVAKNETITINGARTETVAKNETISINGARTESVAKDETISISGGRTENVAKDESITISGAQTVDVAKDRSHSIGKNDTQKVGKVLVIDAGDSITIKTGKAIIQMKKDGDITIEGKKISVKASGDIVLKGQKILEN